MIRPLTAASTNWADTGNLDSIPRQSDIKNIVVASASEDIDQKSIDQRIDFTYGGASATCHYKSSSRRISFVLSGELVPSARHRGCDFPRWPGAGEIVAVALTTNVRHRRLNEMFSYIPRHASAPSMSRRKVLALHHSQLKKKANRQPKWK
ncbi:hypothetical protein EVAR_45812_1 [Eumeta japonica]|uniref:Uncharacterized protein n=1 Tax=Eumeta variegata TaxID=151549 RepID=A0A4C1WZW4_EUMVA|nr:hypothetical protein EVAR_45812_1 [Eumeta japonica]